MYEVSNEERHAAPATAATPATRAILPASDNVESSKVFTTFFSSVWRKQSKKKMKARMNIFALTTNSLPSAIVVTVCIRQHCFHLNCQVGGRRSSRLLVSFKLLLQCNSTFMPSNRESQERWGGGAERAVVVLLHVACMNIVVWCLACKPNLGLCKSFAQFDRHLRRMWNSIYMTHTHACMSAYIHEYICTTNNKAVTPFRKVSMAWCVIRIQLWISASSKIIGIRLICAPGHYIHPVVASW